MRLSFVRARFFTLGEETSISLSANPSDNALDANARGPLREALREAGRGGEVRLRCVTGPCIRILVWPVICVLLCIALPWLNLLGGIALPPTSSWVTLS